MNQHYVPRVYLKNFSRKRGKDFFVDVYDITTKDIFNTNIKNICAEKDFYTLESKGPKSRDRLIVEKFYSEQIEPLYERAYNILTNDKISIISSKIRKEILLGIFQLYARNPQILKISIENHKSIIENLHEEATSQGLLGITYLDDYLSFK
jgi:hypothetical protein